jgi:hypothetical protein
MGAVGFFRSAAICARSKMVEFQVKEANSSKHVVVELSQPIYFVAWQSVNMREVPPPMRPCASEEEDAYRNSFRPADTSDDSTGRQLDAASIPCEDAVPP